MLQPLPGLDSADLGVDQHADAWMRAAELELCRVQRTQENTHPDHMGRASGPKYNQVPSNGPPGRPWKAVPARARAALEASALLAGILRLPSAVAQQKAHLQVAMAKQRGAWAKQGLPCAGK